MNKIAHILKDPVYLNEDSQNVKRSAWLFLGIVFLSFITACSSLWEPSDSEAVHLVENYYLFARAGKGIDAEIRERGEYIRECKCFPVKFRIMSKQQESFDKTFYFFKNAAGIVEVREYQFALMK